MSVNDEIYQSLLRLRQEKPYDQITFAEVAQVTGVHWTTVRRCFGGKREMREWLQAQDVNDASEKPDTRSRLLDAAGFIFSTRGYSQASLDLVAEHAHMTKGAVYWHFSSKQDLFLALLEVRMQQQIRYLHSSIQALRTTDNSSQSLKDLIQTQLMRLTQVGENPGLFMEFVVASREPEIKLRLVQLQRAFLNEITQLIAELQQSGHLQRQVDPDQVSLLLDAIMKGTAVEWMIDPERAGLDRYIQTVCSFLWRYLIPD